MSDDSEMSEKVDSLLQLEDRLRHVMDAIGNGQVEERRLFARPNEPTNSNSSSNKNSTNKKRRIRKSIIDRAVAHIKKKTVYSSTPMPSDKTKHFIESSANLSPISANKNANAITISSSSASSSFREADNIDQPRAYNNNINGSVKKNVPVQIDEQDLRTSGVKKKKKENTINCSKKKKVEMIASKLISASVNNKKPAVPNLSRKLFGAQSEKYMLEHKNNIDDVNTTCDDSIKVVSIGTEMTPHNTDVSGINDSSSFFLINLRKTQEKSPPHPWRFQQDTILATNKTITNSSKNKQLNDQSYSSVQSQRITTNLRVYQNNKRKTRQGPHSPCNDYESELEETVRKKRASLEEADDEDSLPKIPKHNKWKKKNFELRKSRAKSINEPQRKRMTKFKSVDQKRHHNNDDDNSATSKQTFKENTQQNNNTSSTNKRDDGGKHHAKTNEPIIETPLKSHGKATIIECIVIKPPKLDNNEHQNNSIWSWSGTHSPKTNESVMASHSKSRNPETNERVVVTPLNSHSSDGKQENAATNERTQVDMVTPLKCIENVNNTSGRRKIRMIESEEEDLVGSFNDVGIDRECQKQLHDKPRTVELVDGIDQEVGNTENVSQYVSADPCFNDLNREIDVNDKRKTNISKKGKKKGDSVVLQESLRHNKSKEAIPPNQKNIENQEVGNTENVSECVFADVCFNDDFNREINVNEKRKTRISKKGKKKGDGVDLEVSLSHNKSKETTPPNQNTENEEVGNTENVSQYVCADLCFNDDFNREINVNEKRKTRIFKKGRKKGDSVELEVSLSHNKSKETTPPNQKNTENQEVGNTENVSQNVEIDVNDKRKTNISKKGKKKGDSVVLQESLSRNKSKEPIPPNQKKIENQEVGNTENVSQYVFADLCFNDDFNREIIVNEQQKTSTSKNGKKKDDNVELQASLSHNKNKETTPPNQKNTETTSETQKSAYNDNLEETAPNRDRESDIKGQTTTNRQKRKDSSLKEPSKKPRTVPKRKNKDSVETLHSLLPSSTFLNANDETSSGLRRSGRTRRPPPPRSAGTLFVNDRLFYKLMPNSSNASISVDKRKKKSSKSTTSNVVGTIQLIPEEEVIQDEPSPAPRETTETNSDMTERASSKDTGYASEELPPAEVSLNAPKVIHMTKDGITYPFKWCCQTHNYKNLDGMEGIALAFMLQNNQEQCSSGVLRILPGQLKKSKKTETYNMFFTITKGEALVSLESSYCKLSKGAHFLVLKGLSYSIKNTSETNDLEISFLRFTP